MSTLIAEHLSKAFGGTRALTDVRLEVNAGRVVAVLGENGAGKSTLMKLLAGSLEPDSGSMTLSGDQFSPRSPDDARRRGIALVPQEPELALHLSVEENVVLGAEPTRYGFVDKSTMRSRAYAALEQVTDASSRIDPAAPAASLSASERQRVVIARALAVAEPKVLIFDEPTSSLTATDVERLFDVIGRLKARGTCVLYVSHFLDEVMRVADDYCVLRDGKNAGDGSISNTSVDELVALMAGGTSHAVVERDSRSASGEVVLSVHQLAGKKLPKHASLELRAGEVLGIAGLVGAGRSELLRTIFGLAKVASGEIKVGVHVGPASPVKRLEQGVGLLSEDRKGEGLAMQLSLVENLVMSKRVSWGPFVRASEERRTAIALLERLRVRFSDPDQPIAQLSGGNQQKIAIARLLHQDVDVLLLDEPTRGIDVGSRADVHQLIEELASSGKAVLLVSSYLPELMGVCDRIAVMSRGRLGSARVTGDLDEHAILREAAGA